VSQLSQLIDLFFQLFEHLIDVRDATVSAQTLLNIQWWRFRIVMER
jgi:hypothetical protein